MKAKTQQTWTEFFFFPLQTDFSLYKAIISFVNVGGVHWKLLVSDSMLPVWNPFVLLYVMLF